MKIKILLSLMLISVCSFAQNSGYAGRDFWTTSFRNPYLDGPDSSIVYIIGDTMCAGYVENPNTTFNQTFNVAPGQVTVVKIPKDEIQFDIYQSSVELKGVHISTTKNVYAYLQTGSVDTVRYGWIGQGAVLQNLAYGVTRKYPIVPTHALASRLRLTGGGSMGCEAGLVAVALEDSTMITYANRVETSTFLLNRGEVINYGNSLFIPEHSYSVETNCKEIALYTTRMFGLQLYPCMNQAFYDGRDYIVKIIGNRKFSKTLTPATQMHAYIQNPDVQCYSCNRLNEVSNSNYINIGEGEKSRYSVYHDVYCYLNPPPFLRSVPYVFFRYTDFPRLLFPTGPIFTQIHGNFRYVGGGSWRTIASCDVIRYSNAIILPNDIMVKKWVIPTTRDNVRMLNYDIDTTFAELDIYVHEDGIGTTYLNGQLLPSTVFDTVPYTNRDYYVAQFDYYNQDIPEIIRVENENGFSAYLDEFGYSQVGNTDSVRLFYYHDNNSGVNFEEAPVAHSNLSPYNNDTVYRCLGDTLLLTVEHNPDSLSFDWIVNGVTHYDTRTLYVPLISLDTLVAQLVINYPCPDTVTTFVVVVPPPVLPFSTDTTVCAGTLLSVENPAALSYLWSTGDTLPAIRIDSAGIYSVMASNRGCTARLDSFYVSLYAPSSVDFGADTFLCHFATLLLDAQQQHPATYEWQDHSTNTSYTVVEDGDYWVVVSDHCLGATDTINVGYLNDFTLELGTDTLLCEGDELLLSPGIPYCNYVWQDGSSTSSFVVRHPGEYSVTATNHCFTHSDGVSVEYQPCAQELYLPNSFTPDGDGLNDRFAPVFSYPDEVESFEMLVYDRHGGVVYATKDMRMGWDGTGVPQGMYTYIIRYKSARNAEQLVKGTVTLLR